MSTSTPASPIIVEAQLNVPPAELAARRADSRYNRKLNIASLAVSVLTLLVVFPCGPVVLMIVPALWTVAE